jgi:hypothetical protein
MLQSAELASTLAGATAGTVGSLVTWLAVRARVSRLERLMRQVLRLLLWKSRDRPLTDQERELIESLLTNPEIMATGKE